MHDYDALLEWVAADARDRDRWQLLCDYLEEDGFALGGRLRNPLLCWDQWRAEGFVHPASPAPTLQRVLVTMVATDPEFGPRAGVLRRELEVADRIGAMLRGR